ncbi:uncharacterized protein [Henckelia pumila]|uniref:uncharacterized protein isoform X2 n=1 Tax=Henckelia pumila TaxID=405737 RepID=UPI003C6DF2FB
MKIPHSFIIFNTLPPPRLSAASQSQPLKLADSLQAETLKILEWPSVCKQLSAFTSTPMGLHAANSADIPLGKNPFESKRLLAQTSAAVALSGPLDFSGVQDVSAVIDASVAGEMLSIGELCSVGRTLRSARSLLEQLEEISSRFDSPNRLSPLLEILQNCDFLIELEQKIGFCINCDFSVILDQASEELEIIRSERKRNMENLGSMMRRIATQIFQSGGNDRPLVTTRRSRMCVAIKTKHRHLLPKGVVLDSSSSGATYFMEPREAVELNNLEVRLSNSEKMEEQAILSLLSAEISQSSRKIKFLLDRVLELDLVFARASHAGWMSGVCPNFSSDSCEDSKHYSLSVDLEGVQHPLLLESSLKKSLPSSGQDTFAENSDIVSGALSFPVPIDIKIKPGKKVVVISGPNTGGKTASMKTLGLASIMSKAGMYLPAQNNPLLPWFDLVLADIGDHQILEEADDLDQREAALKAKETQQIRKELKIVKTRIDSVVQQFENDLTTTTPDQSNSLLKKSESSIASIIQAYQISENFPADRTSFHIPEIGEQVRVKGLGIKLATVVEAPANDDTVLVQYGKIRARANLGSISALKDADGALSSTPRSKRQGQQKRRLRSLSLLSENIKVEETYSPVVQTSKNTLDLRGMRAEEAKLNVDMALNASGVNSVLFIIHGMGTGVLKELVLELLRNHPRVAKFEQENPMNYGCTVAYIK